MQTINVAIIGFGEIGSGVVESLLIKRNHLRQATGLDIRLNWVCDKDLDRDRNIKVKVDRHILIKNADEVVKDPNVDIIVELIGGIEPARSIIINSLKEGKDVVTANKALLAESGIEIFKTVLSTNSRIRFEASVGGGIPIIKALRNSFVSNKIEAIYGIINGTSNFILSKMSDEGIDFNTALKKAQQMGVAEADPTLDVGGFDSAHKLAILTLLGFKVLPHTQEIYCEGILDIDPCDIIYAQEAGYQIKLLAISKKIGSKIEARVHPTLITKDHLLANVKGVYNAIYVKGDQIGESLFYGKGAGRYPTSSAVVSDIVDLALSRKNKEHNNEMPLLNEKERNRVKFINMKDIKSRYYIRFSAIDKPGVLSAISGILGRHNISIASVSQKEERKERAVPIVMMTHLALERDLNEALKKIDRLPVIKKKTVSIRVESL